MAYTPEINLKGIYLLKEPFNTAMLVNVPYTPVSVRSIPDLLSEGLDPFELYYNPAGLTKEVYDADVVAGVLIVSFRADDGNFVRVPNTYVTGQPNIGGVPYRTLLLGVPLAPLPDSYDLTFLLNRISDLVFDTIGVRASVIPVVASPPSVMSQSEHEATEAARKANISATKTDLAKYIETKKQLDDAVVQIQLRDDYITANDIGNNP